MISILSFPIIMTCALSPFPPSRRRGISIDMNPENVEKGAAMHEPPRPSDHGNARMKRLGDCQPDSLMGHGHGQAADALAGNGKGEILEFMTPALSKRAQSRKDWVLSCALDSTFPSISNLYGPCRFFPCNLVLVRRLNTRALSCLDPARCSHQLSAHRRSLACDPSFSWKQIFR